MLDEHRRASAVLTASDDLEKHAVSVSEDAKEVSTYVVDPEAEKRWAYIRVFATHLKANHCDVD